MTSTHKTYCRNCMSACGLEVDVSEGRIEAIRGDDDNVVSKGYLCVKGHYSKTLHNGGERLTAVHKRGADGRFDEVTTSAALDDIGRRLTQLIAKHGPRSVALYYGTGTAFGGLSYIMAKTWLDAIGSPELYTSLTIDQSAKIVTLGRMGAFATGKPMLMDVDVAMMVGINPIISHLGVAVAAVPAAGAAKWLKKSQAQGVKLIVVDPRRTETAQRAHLHLQIKPGEDATLFAAMINLIFKEGWENRQFCDRFVTSVERLREAVRDYTLEFASARTGLPAEQIVEATRLFATARRQTASAGTGASMSAHSNLMDHLLECLNAICGGYRKAGDPIRSRGALFALLPDVETVVPPSRGWDSGPRHRSTGLGRINGEFPTSRLPDEILWPGEDRIRALICFGSNPATAIVDTDKTVKALKSLELLVVVDPRMTETGRLAHYVIPTKLPYERADMTVTADNWFHLNFVQYTPPLIPSPPGMLEDWEVLWELAHRMKTPLKLKKAVYGVPHHLLPPGVDIDLDVRPSTDEMLAKVCDDSRMAFDDIRRHPSGVTLPSDEIVRAASVDDGARLDVCPTDVFDEIRTLRAEADDADAGFRYRLTSRRLLHVANSAFLNDPAVRKRHAVAPLFMHPQDIADSQLAAEQRVYVESVHGTISARLKEDATMRRGVVSMPHGWGGITSDADESMLTGRLVSLDRQLEAINFMPRQSGIPVNIRACPAS